MKADLSTDSYLMVCLCSNEGTELDNLPGAFCEEHETVTLKSLVESDMRCLLHIKEADGTIRPLTAEDFQPKQRGREFI